MESRKEVSIAKIRWKLFLLGLFKIPLIFFVSPRINFISSEKCIVKIKLKRRTKNHLNSMYFGAMAVGADVAVGIHAYYLSESSNCSISLAFKSFRAEFLKRAETDIVFYCEQGTKIKQMIETSKSNQKRINEIIEVNAIDKMQETVARFQMELSIKVK